ncbi:unnamed protein product [Rotaria sp. Silwood2]|nr:unnamed protein product [Rotaria sp. Silwood2]CAF3997732.1 unnamed protein product [Rotaria sp. Silwood2]CAF4445143.1 unnamed protein product [Rotaria sp. Silwood2]
MKQIDGNNRLWQVDLMLTGDTDAELYVVTGHMREVIYSGAEGWDRLGTLLFQLGEFDKAQEVYDILLDQTRTDYRKSPIYKMLGKVKTGQGEYKDTIAYFQQSIEIQQKILQPTDVDFATTYSNIGPVYLSMTDYPNALSYHQKALDIYQKTLPSNHPDLAASYNNIGLVHEEMGDYSNALSFSKRALEIGQCLLPANHPLLLDFRKNLEFVKRIM